MNITDSWIGSHQFTEEESEGWPVGVPFPLIYLYLDRYNTGQSVLQFKFANVPFGAKFSLFLRADVLPEWVSPNFTLLTPMEDQGVSWAPQFSGWLFFTESTEGQNDFVGVDFPSFLPSQINVVAQNASPLGDPFIVLNPSPSGVQDRYILYYFDAAGGVTRTYYKTAQSLEGNAGNTWSSATLISSLDCHKFVLLTDEEGKPFKIDGYYHGYGSVFINTSQKVIQHYKCATLLGSWIKTPQPVVGLGFAGTYDSHFADTPACTYNQKSKQIYLWYMGAPATSMPDTGLASVVLIAKSKVPDSGFVKDASPVIKPSLTPSSWMYGWMGGVQVRRSKGQAMYSMIFNAGNTRPTIVGDEPPASQIGFASSGSMDGPWTMYENNPIIRVSTSTNVWERVNVWRGYMIKDEFSGLEYLYYNCGATSIGGEMVTYARNNCGGAGLSASFVLTAATAVIPNTNLLVVTPGDYMASIAGVIALDATAAAASASVTVQLYDYAGLVLAETTVVVGKGLTASFGQHQTIGLPGPTGLRLRAVVNAGYESGKISFSTGSSIAVERIM